MKIVLQVQLVMKKTKKGVVNMEEQKIALAMFAKTPGVSKLKTRLAKKIGTDLAEEFYKKSLLALEEIISNVKLKNKELDVYWALGEKDTGHYEIWKNFKTMWTGEGDLGARLYNVSKELLSKYKSYIIIGTDSPQLPEKIISDTIYLLNNKPNKTFIGPSVDGGFYLFASNVLFPKEVWTEVTYSQDDTLEQLLNNMSKNNIEYEFFEKLIDVDEKEDLESLYKYLKHNKNNTNQNILLEWIKDII